MSYEFCGAEPRVGYNNPNASKCCAPKGHPPRIHLFIGVTKTPGSTVLYQYTGPSREDEEAADVGTA